MLHVAQYIFCDVCTEGEWDGIWIGAELTRGLCSLQNVL